MSLFEGNVLFLSSKVINFENRIINALRLNNTICVLFKDDPKIQFFHNLWGIDENGNKLWEAENPDYLHPGENYYQIEIKGGNLEARACTFNCLIDIKTGKIKEKIFTK